MSDIRQRLIRCFQTVFPNLTPDEASRATMASVGTWDSLATVTLLAVVEEEFSIQVEPEDLGLLLSFELILDYLGHVHDKSS